MPVSPVPKNRDRRIAIRLRGFCYLVSYWAAWGAEQSVTEKSFGVGFCSNTVTRKGRLVRRVTLAGLEVTEIHLSLLLKC